MEREGGGEGLGEGKEERKGRGGEGYTIPADGPGGWVGEGEGRGGRKEENVVINSTPPASQHVVATSSPNLNPAPPREARSGSFRSACLRFPPADSAPCAFPILLPLPSRLLTMRHQVSVSPDLSCHSPRPPSLRPSPSSFPLILLCPPYPPLTMIHQSSVCA